MNLDLKEMLKAGIHFGHKTARWNPSMRPFIWGAKNKVHLIDVSKTAFLLERTGKYLKKLAANGGVFLWVGTKKAAQKTVKETAINLKHPYVINRWIGGTLSNFEQVKKAITRLLHLRDVIAKPTVHYTKKEIVMLNKEVDRLERNVGGIIDLQYPPAAVIVIDAKKEQSSIKESSRLGIPVIGVVDTNTNPKNINFLIPANDDSPKSIRFITNYLSEKISEGVAEFNAKKLGDPKQEKKNVKKAEDKPVKKEAKKEAVKTETKDAKAAVKTEKKETKATTVKKTTAKATTKKEVTAKPKVEVKKEAKKEAK